MRWQFDVRPASGRQNGVFNIMHHAGPANARIPILILTPSQGRIQGGAKGAIAPPLAKKKGKRRERKKKERKKEKYTPAKIKASLFRSEFSKRKKRLFWCSCSSSCSSKALFDDSEVC